MMNNNIILSLTTSCYIEQIDLLTANTPFYHIDRISPFNVLIYVISGAIYVSEDDQDYCIEPGQMILLKKGLHQSGKYEIESGTSWIYAHFHTYDVIDNTNDVASTIKDCIFLPKKIAHLQNTDFEGKLYNLMHIYQSDSVIGHHNASILLHKLLIELYEASLPVSTPQLSDQIAEYLEKNKSVALEAKDLEESFHMSYKYLSRVFKNQMNTSIMQYHTKLKILSAARDLRATDLPISHISEAYGINDQLYFSRLFKKHMGVSPRDYRKQQIAIISGN